MVAVAATYPTKEAVKTTYVTTDAAVLMSKAAKDDVVNTLNALAGADDAVVRTLQWHAHMNLCMPCMRTIAFESVPFDS